MPKDERGPLRGSDAQLEIDTGASERKRPREADPEVVDERDYRRPGGGPERPRSGPGGSRPWGKIAAALAAIGLAWAIFSPGPPPALVPEPDSPAYKQQELIQHVAPIVVSSADIDAAATQQAAEAARRGDRVIPGIANSTPEVVRGLRSGDVQIVRIQLYDSVDVDGDVVSVVLSNGVRMAPFQLTHQAQTIQIPVSRTSPGSVTIRAERDGGGGVTLGIRTSNGEVLQPILKPDQSFTIPIQVR